MAANVQPAPAASQLVEACPSCGIELQGKFCHKCGEKEFHRHDLSVKHFLLHALGEFTHLNSKIFATLRYLFTRPGYLTLEYTSGRKAKYMKPLSLFLLAVASMFLADSIHPRSAYSISFINQNDKSGNLDLMWNKLAAKKHMPKKLLLERIQETIHRVASAAQLVNVGAMACILAVLYRRRYFVEHLVFSLHFLSFTYLATVSLWPLASNLGVKTAASWILFGVETVVFFSYLFTALQRVYRSGGRVETFFKTLLAYAVTQLFIVLIPILVMLGAIISAARA
ncbi:MAG TPA: DUF3667 domain-containing protein [Candidatus Angelobacter sp.]|nr:DUF3667 domain-containing protein [Candidatus Angelobacter sp.]